MMGVPMSNPNPTAQRPHDDRVLFAVLDADVTRRIVLGIGATPDAARADAAEWLGEANADAARLRAMDIMPISESEAAVVRGGDRTWPIEVSSSKIVVP